MNTHASSATFTELIPTAERNETGQAWHAFCPNCRTEVTVQAGEPAAPVYIKSQGGRALTHIEDVGAGTTWQAVNPCAHFVELTPLWFSDDDPYNNTLAVRWSTTSWPQTD
jgi:hypothetical protein